jgi:GNAT superfamily N-acetyltransferase
MTDEMAVTFELEALAPPVDPAFSSMTFPAYRHLLSLAPSVRHLDNAPRREVLPIAVAARDEGIPVGLALAELPMEVGGVPELLSVYVAASHRRRGIAAALVREIEQRVRTAGYRSIRTVYMTGKPGIEAIERILAKSGWDRPSTRMLTIRFSLEEARATPWFGKYRLGSDYEVFPWRDLTSAEREELIRSQQESAWIAPDLQPWDFDARGFEPVSSLGVRYRGKVAGWVINHHLTDELVRFTCSFMRKDVSRMGRIVPVYSESIARLEGTSYRECILTAPVAHRGMTSFVTRWCAPFASFSGETRGTEKRL